MSVRGLPPPRRRVTAYTQEGPRVVFHGDKHDILPQTVYESRCHRQLAGWLVSLTLQDEVRPDLDLRRVVCEYEDVFSRMSYRDYLHRGL